MKSKSPISSTTAICALTILSIGACMDDDARAPSDPDRALVEPQGGSLISAGILYAAVASPDLATAGIPKSPVQQGPRAQLNADSRDSLVQINEFLLDNEEVLGDWVANNERLGALLERVWRYERAQSSSDGGGVSGAAGVAEIIAAARLLLGNLDAGDPHTRVVQGPQRQLVAGILMAFLAESIVLQPDEPAARNEQAALCKEATVQLAALGALETALDDSIDAEFQDASVQIRCTKSDSGGSCPAEKEHGKIPVTIEACFTMPDGGQQCSSSSRHETWKWKHGKWKVLSQYSDSTPTNATLKNEAEALLVQQQQGRLDDGRTLVFGGDLEHGRLLDELARIEACEQVPGYVPSTEPEPVADPAFCDQFMGREVTLQVGMADGSRQTVQVRAGQGAAYHDSDVRIDESSSFTVACDEHDRVTLTQVDLAGTLRAGSVSGSPGYGTVVLTPAAGAGEIPGSWLTPLLQDGGAWVFRTSQGRYLLADEGDVRLGQGDQLDALGAKFAVSHAE